MVATALTPPPWPTLPRDESLLEALIAHERLLDEEAVQAVHQLLYRLLGDPGFKQRFAFSLTAHYADGLGAGRGGGDAGGGGSGGAGSSGSGRRRGVERERGIVESFSVQIFTVPVLTPRLVAEAGLFDTLLRVLQTVLLAAMGTDGKLDVSGWGGGGVVGRNSCRCSRWS